MRLFSNTKLSWPQTLHLFQAARLYPGRWQNYYLYRIEIIEPVCLTTHSPIELLQENSKYYCYDKYSRDKRPEKFGNNFRLISVLNKEPKFGIENWGHIPKVAEPYDIIAIQNDTLVGYPSAVDYK
jgi:hypothetical protein